MKDRQRIRRRLTPGRGTLAARGVRQEVLNVVLAQLLAARGVVAQPELLLGRAMPDVLVVFRGLRLAVEGEVDDQGQAAERAWDKARDRVERGIANVGLALVYPSDLRRLPIDRLGDGLETARLRFSLYAPPAIDIPQWQEGDVDLLRNLLEGAFQEL